MMSKELKNVCDMFLESRDVIKDTFPWQSERLALCGAAMFTSLAELAERRKLENCEDILKNYHSLFSDYRGYVKVPLICRMAQSENPEMYLSDVEYVRGLLKTSIFTSYSEITAAMMIVDHAHHNDYEKIAENTMYIYDLMNNEHPFLTNKDDIPYAAALALSGKEPAALIKEMEDCYDLCSDPFSAMDARQALAGVLTLSDTPVEDKCKKVIDIYDYLKEGKHRFTRGKTCAILGGFASIPMPARMIAEEIMDTDEYLKEQRGMGNFFGIGVEARRMFAAILVMNSHRSEDQAFLSSSVASSIIIEIIVQEAAEAATTAAATSN